MQLIRVDRTEKLCYLSIIEGVGMENEKNVYSSDNGTSFASKFDVIVIEEKKRE